MPGCGNHNLKEHCIAHAEALGVREDDGLQRTNSSIRRGPVSVCVMRLNWVEPMD